MPATIFKRLQDAAALALDGMPEVGGRVFKDLDRALAEGIASAVVVELGDDSSSDFGADDELLRGAVALHVHCIAKGAPVTDVLDPIEQAVHARLVDDPSLGGLALRLTRVNGVRRVMNADDQRARRTVTYQAEFLANQADLTPAT